MSLITLDQAKYYLRIEDALTPEGDVELQSMIDAAERFIERKTGYILTQRTKDYVEEADCKIRVYDTPINSSLAAYEHTLKNGYVLIENQETVSLDVGYTNPADVPAPLRNAALQMLKVWYYESETQNNTTLVPQAVQEVINNYRRFTI